MREITITIQEQGQRLDRYLSKYLPGASSGFLHKMMRKKNIKRNQEKVSGGEKLQEGDRIQIFFSEETLKKFGAPSLKKPHLPDEASGQGRPDESQLEPRGKTGGNHHANHRVAGKMTAHQKNLRKEVRILFQNEDILILHKPAGMLTQKALATDDSLNDYLYDYWREEIMKGKELPTSFRPSVANRLDRNTSGIVMCGITVKGLQILSALLKNREVEKYYLCIVKGNVSEKRKISGYLLKDEKKNQVSLHKSQVPGSSYIETYYEPITAELASKLISMSGDNGFTQADGNNKSAFAAGNHGSISTIKDISFLRVRLITGKSHQIRAHLASEGHPILGDPKYGDPRLNRILKKKGIQHQLLHSSELRIPAGTKDLPPDLSGLHIIDEIPEEFKQTFLD